MATKYIENLVSRLRLLYKSEIRHDIKNDTQLAVALKISKQALSNWIKDEGIPEKRLDEVCRLFLITKEEFCNKDLDILDNALGDHQSAWSKLFNLSEGNRHDFYFERSRSIEWPIPKNDLKGEILTIEEEFRIHLKAPDRWWIVLLLKDTERVKSLCPHDRLKDNRIQGQQGFEMPPGNLPFKAQAPTGQHYLLAFITEKSLGNEIYEMLLKPEVSDYTMEQMFARLNDQGITGGHKALRLSFGIVEEKI